jgi:hypothetical protein
MLTFSQSCRHWHMIFLSIISRQRPKRRRFKFEKKSRKGCDTFEKKMFWTRVCVCVCACICVSVCACVTIPARRDHVGQRALRFSSSFFSFTSQSSIAEAQIIAESHRSPCLAKQHLSPSPPPVLRSLSKVPCRDSTSGRQTHTPDPNRSCHLLRYINPAANPSP